MSKYTEGEIVVVVANTSSHGFEIGEKVRIKQVDWPIEDAYIAESLGTPKIDWALYETEIDPQFG